MEDKKFRKPKIEYPILMKDPYVSKWILNFAEKLRQARLKILNDFLNFLNTDKEEKDKKTPEILILEHLEDIRQKNPLNQTQIGKKQLKLFYEYLLLQPKMSKNSAIQYVYSKLMSFWARNNIPIKLEKGEKPTMGKGIKDKVMRKTSENEEERGRKIKDKKAIFKKVRDTLKTVRDKAILLCKLSTGIDDVDLFNLKIRDFKDGYDIDLGVCYITGQRQKPHGNPIFQAIFNIEACELIKIYLTERKYLSQKHNEKLTEKKRINDNSFLFASNKNPFNKIKPTAFADNIRTACKTLNIENLTPKYLRHWTISVLKSGGIPKEIVKRIVGHKGDISSEYTQLFDDEEEFVEELSDKINLITSLGNGNIKYANLEDKLNKLKDISSEKDLEIKELKNTMNEMKVDLDFLLDTTKKMTTFMNENKVIEKAIKEKQKGDKIFITKEIKTSIEKKLKAIMKTCPICNKTFKPRTSNQIYDKKSCARVAKQNNNHK